MVTILSPGCALSLSQRKRIMSAVLTVNVNSAFSGEDVMADAY